MPTTPITFRGRVARALLASTVTLAFGGCVFDSPYWAQTFATTTTAIPIQTWTTDKTRTVKIECSKAYHGGLYPFGGPETWTLVTNITPSANASYDPMNGTIYSAGKSMVLPAACWNADGAYSPPLYMTALRATQLTASGSTQTYFVFDSAGLECLGRENGKGKSWFSWVSQNCHMTYSGSTTQLPYVRIIASALGASMAASPADASRPMSSKQLAERRAAEPDGDMLARRVMAEDVDAGWAPMMEARLRAAYDAAMPEGTQLMDASCRSTMCRVDVAHRDAAAQMRFVAALAPLGLFSNDGQRGHMLQREDASGLHSTYFIAREGHVLSGAAR